MPSGINDLWPEPQRWEERRDGGKNIAQLHSTSDHADLRRTAATSPHKPQRQEDGLKRKQILPGRRVDDDVSFETGHMVRDGRRPNYGQANYSSLRREVTEIRGRLAEEAAMAESLHATCEAKSWRLWELQEESEHMRRAELRLSNKHPLSEKQGADSQADSERRSDFLEVERKLTRLEQQTRHRQSELQTAEVQTEKLEDACSELLNEIDAVDEIASRFERFHEQLTDGDVQPRVWEEHAFSKDIDVLAQLSRQANDAQEEVAQGRAAAETALLTVRHFESDVAKHGGSYNNMMVQLEAKDVEFNKVRRELEAVLPATNQGLGLEQLLDIIEAEWSEACNTNRLGKGVIPAEEGARRERAQNQTLRTELDEVEGNTNASRQGSQLAETELTRVRSIMRDMSPQLGELPGLRQENKDLRRQQLEWKKSEPRMLRLMEDLQREKIRGIQTQKELVEQVAELQDPSGGRKIPPHARASAVVSVDLSPKQDHHPSAAIPSKRAIGANGSPIRHSPKHSREGQHEQSATLATAERLEAIRKENLGLLARLGSLEEEKLDLIQSQEDLIGYIKTKVLPIQEALHLELT